MSTTDMLLKIHILPLSTIPLKLCSGSQAMKAQDWALIGVKLQLVAHQRDSPQIPSKNVRNANLISTKEEEI